MKAKGDVSRREFLSRGVSGVAAAGVLGISGTALAHPNPKKSASESKEKKIIHRTLGKTGVSLPIVNMGVMNADNPDLLKKAYELGVRHFDTAAYYQRGHNEEMVGAIIKELKARDKVIIGTKVFIPTNQRNRMTPDQIREFFLKTAAASLKRLQTDYIDIFYSHNVPDVNYLNNSGIMEALHSLKEQGKVRFLGFSTHHNMAECIADATTSGNYDVIQAAFNYSMADDAKYIEVLKKASSKGIGLIAMKTQCTQYWYRDYVSQDKRRYYTEKTSHTAVLKWVLHHKFISAAIPGYTTYDQLETDFPVAYGLEYTKDEKEFLKDRDVKLSLGYCRQCSRCLPSCPKGVDIPTLMRTHMYAACYTNFHQARNALGEIPKGRGLGTCASCNTCTATCTNQVPVKKRIEELKMIYV